MLRHPPSSTRTATPFPFTPLFRSRQARELGARFLADLPLDRGDYPRQRHRLRAPRAQLRDRVRCQQFALGAERVERMPGDIEAEDRLLRGRSEEHTSELQSLMRISYAVFCLKKKNSTKTIDN